MQTESLGQLKKLYARGSKLKQLNAIPLKALIYIDIEKAKMTELIFPQNN